MSELPAVVVGASVAGVRVVQSLRRLGFERPIILLDRESGTPYDKPPLSKGVLLGEAPTPLLAPAEFDALDVDFRPGVSAVGLDAAAKVLRVSDPLVPQIRYGDLVLASGCVPRRLPLLDGTAGGGTRRRSVHYVRTLADAAGLREALGHGQRVLVVGAGLIGGEVAASARLLGCDVTIVEAGDRMAGRVLAPEPAAHLVGMHRGHGVDVRFGVSAVSVVEEAHGPVVGLSDGSEVTADAVVIGVGAVPAVGWLAGSGLELDDGIRCDAQLRVQGAREVWAVGDVARWPHPDEGHEVRYEHWTSAREQAAAVARTIARGVAAPIAPLPAVWSDQYGVHVQHAGWVTDDVSRRDLHDNGVVFEFRRGDRVVGVTGFDAQREVLLVRRALASRTIGV